MNSEAMSAPLSAEFLAETAKAPPVTTRLRDLTTAIRGGDEAAFTEFYEVYSLRLYKFLLVLAKGDEIEAREILQTLAVKLAKKFEVFEEEGRMWAWLSRLARNAFVDRCRSRARENR